MESNLKDQKPVRLASIWAQDRGRVLGDGKQMLWSVPEDFKHFRNETLGCPIVMGRKSFEAMDSALPGRTNIVLTRQEGFSAPDVIVVGNLDDGLETAVTRAQQQGAETVWVVGGGYVYEESLPLVDELVVTYLDFAVPTANHGADDLVRAPKIDPSIWVADPARSDTDWRERSGDAKWKVVTYVRR